MDWTTVCPVAASAAVLMGNTAMLEKLAPQMASVRTEAVVTTLTATVAVQERSRVVQTTACPLEVSAAATDPTATPERNALLRAASQLAT